MLGDILIANIIASGFLVLIIYLADYNEKEPPWTLVRIYLISIFATFLFAKLKEVLINANGWEFPMLFNCYIVAGFFEELLKLLVVLIFVWPLKTFNEETDGIIYYLIVAAGFSVIENIGYSAWYVMDPYVFSVQSGSASAYHYALQKIVLLRVFSGHIFVNIVSGAFVGLAKRRKKISLLITGFFISVLLHGLWNQMALMGLLAYFAILFAVADCILFWWIVRQSFYYKFLKRLQKRIRALIRQAKEIDISKDLIVLMEGIAANVMQLRMREGDELRRLSRKIVVALPCKIMQKDKADDRALTLSLLQVNGLLGAAAGCRYEFWIWLFVKIAVPGFFLLALLMHFIY